LVVLKGFRSSGLARQLVSSGVEFCRTKGYTRICTYAQKRLVKFWIKSGLSISDTSLEHAFSDFDYVEMVCDTERVTTPPSFETNPYESGGPEGSREEGGILEGSKGASLRRRFTKGSAA
jgi:hypothetical protein